MLDRSKRREGVRGLILIVVGIFMGATLITPAVAHVGGTLSHLWSAPNHIRDKVRVYGDNRWLAKAAQAADANLLDGIDSTGFYQVGDQVAAADYADDAGLLLGRTAADFDDAVTLAGRTAADFDDAVTLAGRTAADFDDAVTLNGKAANGLVRVARMSTSDTLALTTAAQTYGSALSITAPAAGFVLVNSSVTFRESVDCTSNCEAVGVIRHIQSGSTSQSAETSVEISRAHVSNTLVVPVTAGVNTFDLRLWRFSTASGTIQGWWGEMTALYVPFGSTGGGTLGASISGNASKNG